MTITATQKVAYGGFQNLCHHSSISGQFPRQVEYCAGAVSKMMKINLTNCAKKKIIIDIAILWCKIEEQIKR